MERSSNDRARPTRFYRTIHVLDRVEKPHVLRVDALVRKVFLLGPRVEELVLVFFTLVVLAHVLVFTCQDPAHFLE